MNDICMTISGCWNKIEAPPIRLTHTAYVGFLTIPLFIDGSKFFELEQKLDKIPTVLCKFVAATAYCRFRKFINCNTDEIR